MIKINYFAKLKKNSLNSVDSNPKLNKHYTNLNNVNCFNQGMLKRNTWLNLQFLANYNSKFVIDGTFLL